MENAALVFRVQAAEEKVDVLEGKVEEMEKSLGCLQTKLHCRRRSRRHSPIVTIGSGSHWGQRGSYPVGKLRVF